jgi:lipopolysaccharide/colanic/teichoic acid biosynthesis glycosyltransferase
MRFAKPRGDRGGKGPSLSRQLWHTLDSLPSQEQIERLITREVARAERNGLHFSLVLFRVKRGGRLGVNERRLALTLMRRVRVTDEVGWFDGDHLSAILPDTSAQGAQVFADAVCDQVALKGPRPISVVYSFPFDWIETDAEAASADKPAGRGGDSRDDDHQGGGNGRRDARGPASPTRAPGLTGRLGLGDLVGQDDAAPPRPGGANPNNGHHGHGQAGSGHSGNGHSGNGHSGAGHKPHGNAPGGPETLNRLGGEFDGGVAVLERPARVQTTVSAPVPVPAVPPAATVKPVVKPVHELLVQPMPWWKRAIDLAGATAVLTVASPVLLAAAAAVKLTSKGPVVFTQRRAGLGGRPFTIYKFRTMCADAEAQKKALRARSEQDGPAFKMARDPRITRVGAFLRKTSIDELPQLFNVLKGDMSLVGPRPLPIDEQNAAETWQQRRLAVTPGLTCIWQIEGRSKVTFAEWVRMDVSYMRRRTFVHDLAILFKTVPAVLLRRGAK